jgi:hypothetical protein
MPFDFELSFTGLCLFVLEGDKRKPDKLTTLMVSSNGHNHGASNKPANGDGSESHAHTMAGASRGDNDLKPNGSGGHTHGPSPQDTGSKLHTPHIPLLTYSVRNLTVRSLRPPKLIPGPDSLPIGVHELTGPATVGLAQGRGSLEGTWRPEELETLPAEPPTEADEAWLDWLLNIRVVTGVRSLLGLEHIPVRIDLQHGTLEASHVVRGQTGKYLIWDFKDDNGFSDSKESRALASLSVLRMKNLETPVRIHLPEGFVELAPARADSREGRDQNVVRASITNLPNHEINESERPEHLKMYFSLLAMQPRAFRLPQVQDILDTPNSLLCPPGTH